MHVELGQDQNAWVGMIFIGQASLRRAVADYMEHYPGSVVTKAAQPIDPCAVDCLCQIMVQSIGVRGLVEC